MNEIDELLQTYFGITSDQIDSAEGRAALGEYYNVIQGIVISQDVEALQNVINGIQNQTASNASTPGAPTLISQRAYYVLDEETGGLKKIEIPSAFPEGFASFYNITLQPELIAGLQKDLERNGVVPSGYFDGEDDFGTKTTEVLSLVLDYADKYIFIDKNDEQGQKLIEQYGQGHYGFTEGESEDITFGRAILDLAIQSIGRDVRQQEEVQAKLQDEQALQALAASYTIPSYVEMDDTIDEIFNQLVPRSATQKEKDRYVTALAEQYSTKFKQLQALEKAVRTNNIFEEVPAIPGLPEGMMSQPTKQQLRTSIFQITDPEMQVQAKIKQDLEQEMTTIEKANAARKQQSALIQAMLGQL